MRSTEDESTYSEPRYGAWSEMSVIARATQVVDSAATYLATSTLHRGYALETGQGHVYLRGENDAIERFVEAPAAKAPAAAFVAQLLAATGVDPYAFLLEADFATMRHADEATYASRLWQWDPAEEDARAAAG